MKKARLFLYLSGAVLIGALATGCDSRSGEAHGHEHGDGSAHGHSHGDDAESFSGASHKESKGITLMEETRRALALETVEVSERQLSGEIRFTGRVVPGLKAGPPSNSRVVSGTVSTNAAAAIRPGLTARYLSSQGQVWTGAVQKIARTLSNDEPEVLVELSDGESEIPDGSFGEVTVVVPAEREVLTVPREAVIRGVTGDLVYAVNGDAYLLTWVELGASSDGFVEVTDGLLAGDRVVTRGVMDLWLVELRAQKGGQGCCPAPPKKGKG